LHDDVHHALADDVAVVATMNGRHVVPWATYAEDGTLDTDFPPTDRVFPAVDVRQPTGGADRVRREDPKPGVLKCRACRGEMHDSPG